MITNTRNKLNEASYFLEQMKNKQSDRDAFRYNLSAFLSAARSVTWVMKKEFDKAPGFEKWYEKAQGDMNKDSCMKFFNEKRRMTIHIEPVKPQARVDVTIYVPAVNITASTLPPTVTTSTADETTGKRVKPELTTSFVTPASVATTADGEAVTKWRWYFKELPDKDVATACEEHIKKLEDLVVGCESEFMPKQIGEADA
jgi:hypothetical protein